MSHISSPEPDPDEFDRVLSEMERSLADAADGYTSRVRELESTVAEADRIRALPTEKVLVRQQELAEAAALDELDTDEHLRKLDAAGDRERAELAAEARIAYAQRRLNGDPNIAALLLARKRKARLATFWLLLLAAMAWTAVNVQKFAAGTATPADPRWWVSWLVDPLLSGVVVALLLTKGDLAGRDPLGDRPKRWILAVELGALGACLLMNIAPELDGRHDWESIALEAVIPLVAMGIAIVIPICQQRYADAIDALSADGDAVAVDPWQSRSDLRESTLRRGGSRGVVDPQSTRSIEELRTELLALMERNPGAVDITSAESIRKHLRCAANRARQLRDEMTQNPQ